MKKLILFALIVCGVMGVCLVSAEETSTELKICNYSINTLSDNKAVKIVSKTTIPAECHYKLHNDWGATFEFGNMNAMDKTGKTNHQTTVKQDEGWDYQSVLNLSCKAENEQTDFILVKTNFTHPKEEIKIENTEENNDQYDDNSVEIENITEKQSENEENIRLLMVQIDLLKQMIQLIQAKLAAMVI